MSHALAISLADPDPHFLNYPSLLIYLIAIIDGALTRSGLLTEPWQAYVVGRSVVAAFGALTAPAAFWLGLELAGAGLASGGAGLLGASLGGLWVALLPLHVWESHFAVTDVVMTFWTTVVLAGSVRLLRGGGVRDHLLVGAALGLAIASKYTAALAGLSPLVATLLARRPFRTSLGNLVVIGLAALVACFLGTPFSFLHFSELRTAMAYEYGHVHSLHYGFSLPAFGWQYHKYVYELFAGFPFSLGLALYASVAAGTAWILLWPRRESLVVLGFALPFFAILGYWTFKPLRYMLPVLVVGVVFAGLWQASWIASGRGWRRNVGGLAAGLALLYTTLFTLSTTARFGHDTRIEAGHWLDQTLPPGQQLLLCGFTPYMARPNDPRILFRAVNEGRITNRRRNVAFDLVEISSLHFWRWERHRHPAFDPAYQRFRAGEEGFHLVKSFEGDFLNRDFYRRLDPMFAGYFISPTVEFYARDESAEPPH
jgi:dolichyl-phosphate-mannose-protein mannosyltransferase